MILSRSSEYAIRAFVYLAQQEPGRLVMAKQIAEDAGLPGHFLAKLLQQLARKGLIRSNKGPSGGFMLNAPPKGVSLLSIVEGVDGSGLYDRCPLGHENCADNKTCAVHDGWMGVRSRIVDYLEHTSLADVSKSLANGHKKRKAAKAR